MGSASAAYEENQEIDDSSFDCLPDEIVLSIFNKVGDAKSLCASMSVCKRFQAIVPQVDSVSLFVPRHNAIPITSKDQSSSNSKNLFKTLVRKFLIKPLNVIFQAIKSSKSSSSADGDDDDCCTCHPPHEILKPFGNVQSLEIQLPSEGEDIIATHASNTTFLKWKAEFGRQIQSCVILGAKSFCESAVKNQENQAKGSSDSSEEGLPLRERPFNDDELKLRVVWTLSSIIAASSRHYLLHEVVKEHQRLESLVVKDEGEQGRLEMNCEQIKEMRAAMEKEDGDDSSLEKSRVPALKMKMWYVPELEVAGGVMKGATLVAVRPVDDKGKSYGDLVRRAFDGEGEEEKVFREAARKLLKKKRSYTLEMNSF